MKRFIILALCGFASAASAQGFDLNSIDRYNGAEFDGHYQRDITLPVQEELRDCFWFEMEAYQTSINDIFKRREWACQAIAHKYETGQNLSDRDKALEDLFLAYEKRAREWVGQSMFRDLNPRSEADKREGNSAVLTSGWWRIRNLQTIFGEETGLDPILELLP